jgi:pimeloyl-ACP methyl ester carboxylesterase
MKSTPTRSLAGLLVVGLSALLIPLSASAGTPDTPVASKTAAVDGVTFHYLTAGHGPALILLHGYAETSLMWRPIIEAGKLVASDVTVVVLKNTGHWVLEENPKETTAALFGFL